MRRHTGGLLGLRILNTRAKHQAATLSAAIQNAGGVPIELPLLSIEPTGAQWVKTLPNGLQADFAIFISPNAVDAFFKHIPPQTLPKSMHIFALGQGTARTLNTYGIHATACPKAADSEHMLTLISHDIKVLAEKTCLLIKGVGGRTYLLQELIKKGVDVHALDVYKRTLPAKNKDLITSLWCEDALDIILITSETALKHLFILFGEDKKTWLCQKPCLVISKRLEHAARAMGIQHILVSTYEDIIETLIHNKDSTLL